MAYRMGTQYLAQPLYSLLRQQQQLLHLFRQLLLQQHLFRRTTLTPFENTPTAGTIDTGAGTSLNYDAGEQQAAQTIANTISEGGVNAATGDNNISAGPNVLSAGDDGVFGFGNDYNNEFQQNYAAQSAHAEANPYGQSTGTHCPNRAF